MAYNYEYPHFEAPQYNMDWILETIKRIEEQVLGLDNYNYEGENKILDLNDLKPNSMASFTENFNVLNAPVSGARRFVFTNGSDTGAFQRCYDLKNMETYERTFTITNGVTSYSIWKKTQHAPGTLISTHDLINSGDFNSLPDNIATLMYTTNMNNAPVDGYGYLLGWKSINDNAKIQMFISNVNKFIYIRNFTEGNWSPWQEANHIDLTKYYKYLGVTDADLNQIKPESIYTAQNNLNSPPGQSNGIVFTTGKQDHYLQVYINYDNEARIFARHSDSNVWSAWFDLVYNYNVIHRYNSANSDEIDGCSFTNLNFTSGGVTGYAALIGIGYSNITDTYQIGLTSNNRLVSRFRNSLTWSSKVEYAYISSSTASIVSSLPEKILTIEGEEVRMPDENIYSQVENAITTTYINLPGQSLLHSDEGSQSFKDAIMASDISDADVIITNFEMWDMDIPLTEIRSSVLDLLVWMRNQNPMCDLTLMSIPPVDIPLWGDEFLDHEMPNGSTVRQLDAEMLKLAEEHGFTYIPFNDFYASQSTNLLEYLGEDMKTNKQYIRRVASFLKNRIM